MILVVVFFFQFLIWNMVCGQSGDICTSCAPNATCTETSNGYNCTCNQGYAGNGTVCEDIDECSDESHHCEINTTCVNTDGSFICTCTLYSSNDTDCIEGLYFIHKGVKYLPGSTVLIKDIGTVHPSTHEDYRGSLVCVTSNVNTQCCRMSDGGNVGEWYFPDATIVPRRNNDGGSAITRSGFTEQIRLNRKLASALGPVGDYECRVPDSNGVMYSATITIRLYMCASNEDCDHNAVCTNTSAGPICVCNLGFTGNGTFCKEGLQFLLKDTTYQHGSSVFIKHIGAASSNDPKGALICSTGNIRLSDTNGIGSWFFPNGNMVPVRYKPITMSVVTGGLGLNRRFSSVLGPVGDYKCEVEDSNGVLESATITVVLDLCDPSGNDCAPNATCTPTPASHTCICNEGLIGNGTVCADGLYFTLDGVEYPSGSILLMRDIGTEASTDLADPGRSLVCVSTNVNTECCRASDGGNIGGWYFPNGKLISRDPEGAIAASGYTQQVRLNRRSNATMGPTGVYRCRVPDSNGVFETASIAISFIEGLYFIFKGVEHLPGSTLLITDIGTASSGRTLLCVTYYFDVPCCRSSDGDNMGEWFFPDGTMVPRNGDNPGNSSFTRTGFSQQIRLNRKFSSALGPVGDYECRMLDSNDVLQSASITIAPDLCITNATCSPNATCTNVIPDNYTCECNQGYRGSGTDCEDIDECDDDSHNCSPNATCTNTDGSFTCSCNQGYCGDGIICTASDLQVTHLRCSSPDVNGNTLSIHWRPASNNASNVNTYSVQVLKFSELEDVTRTQLQPLIPPFNQIVNSSDENLMLNVTSGVEGDVLYQVMVTSQNELGCGQSVVINCTTHSQELATVSGGPAGEIIIGATTTVAAIIVLLILVVSIAVVVRLKVQRHKTTKTTLNTEPLHVDDEKSERSSPSPESPSYAEIHVYDNIGTNRQPPTSNTLTPAPCSVTAHTFQETLPQDTSQSEDYKLTPCPAYANTTKRSGDKIPTASAMEDEEGQYCAIVDISV